MINILAADDEEILLDELTAELEKVFSDACIRGEKDSCAALEWAKQLSSRGERLDYAFLDIRMEGMTGLELAKRIKILHPHAILFFCTAYTEYAFEAVSLFAKGYLLKPVDAQSITKTLDEMVHDWRNAHRTLPKDIRVQTFGHFEFFVDGRPLVFEREKAKELLAYLVDRHGASVTTEQIAAVLWEDRPYNRTMKNYVSTILGALRSTLRTAGVEDILIKTRNHLSLDVERIRCDAYDYEKWGSLAVNSFKGEYMVNYSWAECTTGEYARMESERA